MKKILFTISCLLTSLIIFTTVATAQNSKAAKEPARDYYLIQIYHCSTVKQVELIDMYLKNTLLPYLHNNDIKKVGVFAPIDKIGRAHV